MWVSVGFCVGFGAVFRFSGLGRRDFWFDESCTFVYVHHLFDWPSVSNLLRESTNLPYYILLHGWTFFFGDSEVAYRSFSALAATLTIPLLAAVAYRLGGALAAGVCAALVAFNPLHLHYAHEARAYALWIFVLALAMFLLVEAVRRGSWRWWLAYAIVLVFALHLHYFTVYWAAASIVSVCLASHPRRAFRAWLLTTCCCALAFVPYVLVAVLRAANVGGREWIAQREEAFAVLRSLWAFLPAGDYPAHLRGLSRHAPDTVIARPTWLMQTSEILPAMVVALIFFGVWRLRKRRAADFSPRGPSLCHTATDRARVLRGLSTWNLHLFLGGMTLIPLILMWLQSTIWHSTYLVGRYDLVAWPAFMVWLAVAIAELCGKNRFLTGAALMDLAPKRAVLIGMVIVILLTCSAVPIERMAALRPGPSFSNVRAQRLSELTEAGDCVIAFSYDRDYLQYYLHRTGFRGRIVSFPSWLGQQVGWVDTAADASPARLAALKEDAAQRLAEVRALLAAGRRVLILPDSLDPQGVGPRGPVNAEFASLLEEAGLRLEFVDSDLLIAELHPKS